MILYLSLIFFAALLTVLGNAYKVFALKSFNLIYLILSVVIIIIALFVIDLIFSCLCRWCLPKKIYEPTKGFYRERKGERKIYDFLRVNAWKDKIPEIGGAIGFKKDKINSLEPEYLEKFLTETCYAEVMHITMALSGVLILLVYPIKNLSISLPLIIVNFILNILPVIVQRYNRPKLLRIYKLKIKRSKQK